jgi:hypothetical protein
MNEKLYEQIRKANETIKTTNIKGKDYAEVNQRIKAFRMVYPTGIIETEMVSNENGVCIFRAYVGYRENNDQYKLATGTAYEKENGSFINKTSYIENCETSAIGRALGIAGFGIDTSVASADEVRNAIDNQESPIEYAKEQKEHLNLEDELQKIIDGNNLDYDKICEMYKLKENDIHFMSNKQLKNAIDNQDKLPKKEGK